MAQTEFGSQSKPPWRTTIDSLMFPFYCSTFSGLHVFEPYLDMELVILDLQIDEPRPAGNKGVIIIESCGSGSKSA